MGIACSLLGTRKWQEAYTQENLHLRQKLDFIFSAKDTKHFTVPPDINVNAAPADGTTALHIAAMYDNYDAVEMLLTKGASRHPEDEKGRTPFSFCPEDSKTFSRLFIAPRHASFLPSTGKGWERC